MYPVLIHGPIPIYTYGLMMAIGFLVAGHLVGRELRRRGYDDSLASSLLVSAAVGGLLGSHLLYLAQSWRDLLTEPADLVLSGSGFVWYGGLAGGMVAVTLMVRYDPARCIPPARPRWGAGGALLGAVVGGWLALRGRATPTAGLIGGLAAGYLATNIDRYVSGAARLARAGVPRRGQPPWAVVVDCIAPALALGQAIGRIGCQLAGDGDWGTETSLPWGMAYPDAIVGWHYPPGVRVHPTPLYEAVAYTAVFAWLWRRRLRPHRPGTLLWYYFVLAGTARFAIEFVRINPPVLFHLTFAQVISACLVAVGALLLLRQEASAP